LGVIHCGGFVLFPRGGRRRRNRNRVVICDSRRAAAIQHRRCSHHHRLPQRGLLGGGVVVGTTAPGLALDPRGRVRLLPVHAVVRDHCHARRGARRRKRKRKRRRRRRRRRRSRRWLLHSTVVVIHHARRRPRRRHGRRSRGALGEGHDRDCGGREQGPVHARDGDGNAVRVGARDVVAEDAAHIAKGAQRRVGAPRVPTATATPPPPPTQSVLLSPEKEFACRQDTSQRQAGAGAGVLAGRATNHRWCSRPCVSRNCVWGMMKCKLRRLWQSLRRRRRRPSAECQTIKSGQNRRVRKFGAQRDNSGAGRRWDGVQHAGDNFVRRNEFYCPHARGVIFS
jgi:hypothetical protein